MSDEPLSFKEHRHRRDENASTVRCAKCGEWIIATATRCPECGVHFEGEAQDFTHPSEQNQERRGTPVWAIAVAFALIAAMIVGALCLR